MTAQRADNFTGKTVCITGASRGIGRATALLFAELGADLILTSKGEACKTLAKELEDRGTSARAIQADMSSRDSIHTLFKEIFHTSPHLDILINNAGITRDGLCMRLSEEDWDLVLDINLKGAFFCTKEAIRQMIKSRSGVILNISSIVGLSGNKGQANYAASKAGLIGMTKSIALELATRQIRVNAIAPGFIATDMTKDISEEAQANIREQIPLKRFGAVEDVANLIVFLASEKASYITGQTFIIDGGLSLCNHP